MTRKTSGTWAPMPPPSNQAWQEATRGKDLSDPIPYSPQKEFQTGQVIHHPKYGVGVVMGRKEGSKIIVIFKQRTLKLIHARS